ncbi:MAG: hypothetical protein RSD04_01910 [Clostridia bacterium]
MKRSKRIAVLALMFALIIIFNFVPISFGPVTIGLMILPVLIVAQVEDFKMTIACGLCLGLTNLLSWYTTKAGALLAPVFQNPLVCILPRLFIGVVAYAVCHGFGKLIRPQTVEQDGKNIVVNSKQMLASKNAVSAVSALSGVLTNTLLVGVMAVVCYHGKVIGGTAISIEFILGLFSVNFVIEAIAFSLLTPPIVFALNKIRSR